MRTRGVDDPWGEEPIRRLGRQMREARLWLRLSQRQLEELSGVDQSIISRLENGLIPGSRAENVARIFAALGASPAARGAATCTRCDGASVPVPR